MPCKSSHTSNCRTQPGAGCCTAEAASMERWTQQPNVQSRAHTAARSLSGVCTAAASQRWTTAASPRRTAAAAAAAAAIRLCTARRQQRGWAPASDAPRTAGHCCTMCRRSDRRRLCSKQQFSAVVVLVAWCMAVRCSQHVHPGEAGAAAVDAAVAATLWSCEAALLLMCWLCVLRVRVLTWSTIAVHQCSCFRGACWERDNRAGKIACAIDRRCVEHQDHIREG